MLNKLSDEQVQSLLFCEHGSIHESCITSLLLVVFTLAESASAMERQAALSWLPPPQEEPAEAAMFLKSLSGSFRILACQYDGTKLTTAVPFIAGKARSAGAQWECEVRIVEADRDAFDVGARCTVVSGNAKQAGVAVAFDFFDWRVNNYVLVPAVLYGGKRFRRTAA